MTSTSLAAMTLPTSHHLMDDTILNSVAGLPERRRNGHH